MDAEALCETHYEVHLLQGSRWLIEQVLMQREAAFLAGRELASSGEAAGVRVVKECYRPASRHSTAVVLYEYLRPVQPRRALAPVALTTPARPAITPPPVEAVRAGPASRSWRELAPMLSIFIATAQAIAIAVLLLLS
jgi:hypothetical protein